MSQRHIGALTIGQSPRPDLIAPLASLLPSNYNIVQAGALDDLTQDNIPSEPQGLYPLVTRMQNGATVMVDQSFLSPKLQTALDFLEASDVVATMLLCAGTFPQLKSSRPLYKPFKIVSNLLDTFGFKSIGLIVPVAEQELPVQERWESLGWKTSIWTDDLGTQDQAFRQRLNARIRESNPDCIVLDYVGHPEELVTQLQRSVEIPVIDLGYLTMVTMANTL